MDEGETPVRAGDVLIRRGTNHAWANRSRKTARIAFVLIDAVVSDTKRQHGLTRLQGDGGRDDDVDAHRVHTLRCGSQS